MTVRPHAAVGHRMLLKSITRAAHADAEEQWFSKGYFRSRSTYESWLAALDRVHLSLGMPSAEILGAEHLAEEHARSSALLADVKQPRTRDDTHAALSVSWAWGVLYVLNGSALGAGMLLKSGAIQPGWPTNYVKHMRAFAVTGQLNRFFSALDGCQLERADAQAGAQAVFDCLARQRPLSEAF